MLERSLTPVADPPRFEHGFPAPEARVISRLHYGSSIRPGTPTIEPVARLNGGPGDQRIGGAYWMPPSETRAFSVPARDIRQLFMAADPLVPS